MQVPYNRERICPWPDCGAELEGLGKYCHKCERYTDGERHDECINITVYGSPKPAGSKRAFVIPGTNRASVTDANPKSKPWKHQVAQVAGYEMRGRGLFDGPVSVLFRFFVSRPKGHFNNSGLSAKGRRMPHPTVKPDVLKLARAVEDALSGVVYRDDSQIVDERLVKEYGEPERVEITVAALGPDPILPASENYAVEF